MQSIKRQVQNETTWTEKEIERKKKETKDKRTLESTSVMVIGQSCSKCLCVGKKKKTVSEIRSARIPFALKRKKEFNQNPAAKKNPVKPIKAQ